jgi:hypothetical protein
MQVFDENPSTTPTRNFYRAFEISYASLVFNRKRRNETGTGNTLRLFASQLKKILLRSSMIQGGGKSWRNFAVTISRVWKAKIHFICGAARRGKKIGKLFLEQQRD